MRFHGLNTSGQHVQDKHPTLCTSSLAVCCLISVQSTLLNEIKVTVVLILSLPFGALRSMSGSYFSQFAKY